MPNLIPSLYRYSTSPEMQGKITAALEKKAAAAAEAAVAKAKADAAEAAAAVAAAEDDYVQPRPIVVGELLNPVESTALELASTWCQPLILKFPDFSVFKIS
jgi:hypothetical protein